jgi:diadenosine tetraphosphate (Ap4A) HIT family hydrolase
VVKRLRAEEVDALLRDQSGCAMCTLATATPIAENIHAICALDRFAARRGHLLVVTRRHVESITELSWDEWSSAQRLAWEASRALEQALSPRRIYVAALGSTRASSRTFPHVHIHVVPLEDGGEADRPSEVFTWRHGVLVYESTEAQSLAGSLRATWPSRDA